MFFLCFLYSKKTILVTSHYYKKFTPHSREIFKQTIPLLYKSQTK